MIDSYGNDLAADPVLRMRGLGREIWADTNADEYVANLRAGWGEPELTKSREP